MANYLEEGLVGIRGAPLVAGDTEFRKQRSAVQQNPGGRATDGWDRRIAYAVAGIAALVVFTSFAFFGVVYVTGAAQPFGTLSDLCGAIFALSLVPLVLRMRKLEGFAPRGGERPATWLGMIAGVGGVASATSNLVEELGGPSLTGWEPVRGLGILGTGVAAAVALIAWPVVCGLVFRRSSVPNALGWGIVGATFVGLPFWFAWIARRFPNEPLER